MVLVPARFSASCRAARARRCRRSGAGTASSAASASAAGSGSSRDTCGVAGRGRKRSGRDRTGGHISAPGSVALLATSRAAPAWATRMTPTSSSAVAHAAIREGSTFAKRVRARSAPLRRRARRPAPEAAGRGPARARWRGRRRGSSAERCIHGNRPPRASHPCRGRRADRLREEGATLTRLNQRSPDARLPEHHARPAWGGSRQVSKQVPHPPELIA